MNTRSSAYTGRAARSLEGAFGPYQRHGLHTTPEPMHPHDRIVVTASAIVFAALLIVLFFWS